MLPQLSSGNQLFDVVSLVIFDLAMLAIFVAVLRRRL